MVPTSERDCMCITWISSHFHIFSQPIIWMNHNLVPWVWMNSGFVPSLLPWGCMSFFAHEVFSVLPGFRTSPRQRSRKPTCCVFKLQRCATGTHRGLCRWIYNLGSCMQAAKSHSLKLFRSSLTLSPFVTPQKPSLMAGIWWLARYVGSEYPKCCIQLCETRYIHQSKELSSNTIKKDRYSETHASNFDVRLDTYKNFTLLRYIGLTEASLKSLFSEVPWKTVYGGWWKTVYGGWDSPVRM